MLAILVAVLIGFLAALFVLIDHQRNTVGQCVETIIAALLASCATVQACESRMVNPILEVILALAVSVLMAIVIRSSPNPGEA